jgi:hypothetical protein
MMSKSLLASALIAWSLTIAGCQIYLGDDGPRGGYSFCDETGCYTCTDGGCVPEGAGDGWTCNDNSQCGIGCYCDDQGLCQETGTCTAATEEVDCADGFVCDDRGSCVPEGSDGSCTGDASCPAGTYCDEAAGSCVPTQGCTAEDQCADGYECDEDRGVCVPFDPSLVHCQADVTCPAAPPVCANGTNPGIVDGCWTGECVPDAACSDGVPFECRDLSTEAGCLANAACDPVYRGINCTNSQGASCTSGTAQCTCESFAYDECEPVGG